MTFEDLIGAVSKREEITANPPVLLDLGASGSLNPVWKPIASFCIGIAFDADDREFGFIEQASSAFKKMYVYNSIVTSSDSANKTDFYLTTSPYCSSALRPLPERLQPFHYSALFGVRDKVQLNAKNIAAALDEMHVRQVDWFKTDTQGTDLRLFNHMTDDMQRDCVVAQFEPGIVDAYEGEDKLHHVLAYMDTMPMRLYDFEILGPINLPARQFEGLFPGKIESKVALAVLKPTPGWAGISYVKTFDSGDASLRSFILGWLFMMLEKQFATALYIASIAVDRFPNDALLQQMHRHAEREVKRAVRSARGFAWLLSAVKRKALSRKA